MRYAARLSKLDGLNGLLEFHQDINTDRLRTYYNGDISNIEAEVIFHDPRRFSPQQRALFFALLGDISEWSGQDIEAPPEVIGDTKYLKNYFYAKYVVTFFQPISLADNSESSVSQLNDLISLVLDFMFEFGTPFKDGYKLLQRKESYYLYLCIKHRKCVVCGSHADIHHIDAVGNRKRVTVDHSKLRLVALCRKHHNEAHSLGNSNFCNKYQVEGIKTNYQTLINLGLMTIKQVDQLKEEQDESTDD